jgi:hypothetical protein
VRREQMRNSYILFVSLFLCAAIYGKEDPRPSPPPAYSICTLLSKAADYDGKEVTVRVTYQSNPEGGIGHGSECSHENVRLQNAPDFKPNKEIQKTWRRIGKYKPVDLVVRGRFTVCRDGNCFVGMYWAPYGIQVREYLYVQPAQLEPK